MNNNNWWKGAVIYQIYPRSFLDTNGDGIGDLPGITQKLDYIASLGVDGIWISPFFTSPMKDFGYDVSNYRDVDPMFGDLSDFDTLLEKARSLHIKVIIDLVLSHTSNEHPWFGNPSKKDWYVWADAKTDDNGNRTYPNNWVSVFGGSAWEWSEKQQQYYFHNFLKEQPDLNYHNNKVQDEVLDICKFWFDRGVDGFRLDTVNFYFHDQKLRDNPARAVGAQYATQFEGDTPYSAQQHVYDKSRPENLGFVKKLRALADSYPNKILIGEIGDDHPYKIAKEYTYGDKCLHTAYNPHMMSGKIKKLTSDLITEPIEEFLKMSRGSKNNDGEYAPESWPSWAFSNHDVVRAASRWFNKEFDHDPRLSKMLIALLGCLPGSAFIYQGEELGLPEAKIPFDDLQDPWAKETWPQWQGRDGCRSPMPWTNEKLANLGFSTSEKTWLPIPDTHAEIDVRSQDEDALSTLNFTRHFLKWRKGRPEILSGDYEFIDTNNNRIIGLRLFSDQNDTLCLFNLSIEKQILNGNILHGFEFKIDNFTY